jgi:hypothetical protein
MHTDQGEIVRIPTAIILVFNVRWALKQTLFSTLEKGVCFFVELFHV